MVDGISI
ncbi:uncharacterized protein FFMR_06430 [Fusarium fujikuroi]|nr:uncharacterized protein FFE2_16066 [Fusarium fujikuroi]SCO30723.1 uncharacterized protein FFNC_01680 [Fusarium fujikuroi]SCO41550.1 uncharacterized protein FFMR_06430 [Fusarium fujikuroi]SCO54109.1 uncharacterized protein FFNC_15338 [Fusarium fujikuroi]SCO54379.1 uncharacterized protein FFNC_15489 [Fusarium fujikuroi]